MVPIIIGFWMVGGSKVKPILRLGFTRKRIPADNNAYVYQEQERSASFIFENGIAKPFQNGSPNGLRINESEPSDADVADIFAFQSDLSAVDRVKVELSTGTIMEFTLLFLLDLQQRLL
jgi:hypothetical protein